MRDRNPLPAGNVNQRSLETAVWLVYGSPARAAISFLDDHDRRIRFAFDLYREESARGITAALALLDYVENEADAKDYDLRGTTDADNIEYLFHVLDRGYDIYEVLFRRPRRSERCALSLSPVSRSIAAIKKLKNLGHF